jgi:hypothetical protein
VRGEVLCVCVCVCVWMQRLFYGVLSWAFELVVNESIEKQGIFTMYFFCQKRYPFSETQQTCVGM